MRNPIFCLVLLALATGCNPTTPAGGPIGSNGSSAAPDSSVQVGATPAKHAPVEVFINNRQFGDDNGCTSTFTPRPSTSGTPVKNGSTCGHAGAVSKLTWEYLRTDDAGDHYRFERTFPHGEPQQKTTSKEVLYTGEELVLFEDDVQRIVMRPAAVE